MDGKLGELDIFQIVLAIECLYSPYFGLSTHCINAKFGSDF